MTRALSRAASLAWGGLLLSAPAAAEVTSFIEWEAPASCPDTRALYDRLSTLLDNELTALGDVRVRGSVVESGTGLRLTLEVVDGGRRSSRVLAADDCADLFEASALAIALAVHGDAADPVSSLAPSAAVEQAPVFADVPARADANPRGKGSALRTSWSLGAEAIVDFGALPSAAPGLSVDVRFHVGAWGIGVHGSWLPAQRLAVRAGEYTDFGLLVAGARACRALSGGAWLVGACAAFELGQFSATGSGLASGQQVENLWLAPGLALDGRVALWRDLHLQVGSAALLPLLRKQYAVNGTERVHAPSVIDLRASMGLALVLE